MPNIAPAAYRLKVDGLVDCSADLLARGPQGDAARRAGLRLPLRHRLVVNERALGRRPDRRRARARRGDEQSAAALRFVSAEVPYEDSLTLEAGAAARRDARLRDGRQAALPAARRPRPARDAADVRVQERQVGQPHRARPTLQTGYWEQHGYDADAWLGRSNGFWPATGARPRRGSSASPAPSACSTGPTRRRSSRCSRPG